MGKVYKQTSPNERNITPVEKKNQQTLIRYGHPCNTVSVPSAFLYCSDIDTIINLAVFAPYSVSYCGVAGAKLHLLMPFLLGSVVDVKTRALLQGLQPQLLP